MMERIGKLIISMVDLAEVEVQSLKRGVVRLCFTVVALIGGGILALIGLILVLASAYIALEHAIGRVAALGLVGVAFLGVGAFLLISSLRRGAVAPAPPAAVPDVTDPNAEGATDDASMRIAS